MKHYKSVSWSEQLLVVVALSMIPTIVSAQPEGPVNIDFEFFPGPDGILGTVDDIPAPDCFGDICGPLGDEYSTLGVNFISGFLFQGVLFPGTEPTNHFVSSEPMDTSFAFDVYEVSLSSYSVWPAVLYALDEFDNIVATDVLENSTGNFLLGEMRISSDQPIRRVAALAEGCQVGEPCDHILNVDNLMIDPIGPVVIPPADIPTLSGTSTGILILLLTTGGLWFLRRSDPHEAAPVIPNSDACSCRAGGSSRASAYARGASEPSDCPPWKKGGRGNFRTPYS